MKFVLFTLFLCGFILKVNGKSSSEASLPKEKSLVACEGAVARLQCAKGQAIYVASAAYGRWDRKTCSAGRPAYQLENSECYTYREEVGERCNGKQWCKVRASNYVFGNPCYGTYKYLAVEYICYGLDDPDCPLLETVLVRGFSKLTEIQTASASTL